MFAVAVGSSPLRYVNLNRSIQKTAYSRPSPEACGVRSDPHPSLAGRAHSSVRVEARAIARSAAPFHVPLPRQQSACAAAMHEGQHGYSDQHYAARCSSGSGSCSLVLMTSRHERAKGSCLFARSWQSLRSPRGGTIPMGCRRNSNSPPPEPLPPPSQPPPSPPPLLPSPPLKPPPPPQLPPPESLLPLLSRRRRPRRHRLSHRRPSRRRLSRRAAARAAARATAAARAAADRAAARERAATQTTARTAG